MTWSADQSTSRIESNSCSDNNVLRVGGEDRSSSERGEGDYVIRERRYGKFARSLSFPQGVKASTSKT